MYELDGARDDEPQRRLTLDDDLLAILTVEQAAEVLCISRGLAFAAVRAGHIPHVRLGRRILVPRDALRDMLASGGRPAAGGSSGALSGW